MATISKEHLRRLSELPQGLELLAKHMVKSPKPTKKETDTLKGYFKQLGIGDNEKS